MIKLVYRPVSLLVSVLGGMLAGAIFTQIWKLAAREDDATKATDAQRGWREICRPLPCRGLSTRSSRPSSAAARPRVPAS